MIEIRAAEPGDVEAIIDVGRGALYAAYGGFVRPENVESAIGEWYDPELIETAIEAGEIAFYVAVAEGVVGFASAERTWADEVELHAIYVHPDRWGEGIGSALLERLVQWARQQGVDRIACSAFLDNTVGVEFLRSRGFEPGEEFETAVGAERHPEREFELAL